MHKKNREGSVLSRFKRGSLQQRITISFIVLIAFVVLVVTFIAYQISAKMIVDQTIKNTSQSIELVIEKIDFMRSEIKTYSKLIIANQEIQELAKRTSIDFNHKKHIGRLLSATLEPRTFIDAAVIYAENGNIFVPTNIDLKNVLPTGDIDKINERLSIGGNGFCTNTRSEYYYRDNKNRDIISFYYMMNSSYSGSRIGTLELSVTEQFLSDLYKSVKIGDTGKIFIVDKKGQIITSEDKSKINTYISDIDNYRELFSGNSEAKIVNMNNNKTLVINKSYSQLGWHVIGIVPVRELTKQSKMQSLTIIFSGILCTFIVSIAIARLSKSIANPIMKLCLIVENTIPGDMKHLNSFDRGNCSYEVSMLAQKFKMLNEKTAVLMEETKEAHRLEKEHALNTLQAQMNPHFLYNTLETVCGLIDLEYHNEAIHLVNTISAFYRGVLSKGQTIVTIRDELDIVKYYVDIINIRYNNKLNYFVNIEDSILDQAIIKLTLQPLIENALVHGLIGKSDQWIISLDGIVEKDKIVLIVKDNGVGMSKELFYDLMNSNITSSSGSFALKGTDERIKLHFGSRYGLIFCDTHHVGTEIKIILPMGRGEAND